MKKTSKYKLLMLSVAFGLYVAPVLASPFCVSVQGIAPQCIYDDVTQCRQRAQQLNGLCTPNAAEVRLQPGVGKYCLVYSNHASMCNYSDRSTCDADAQRNGAVCMDFPSSEVQENPYRKDPNSKY